LRASCVGAQLSQSLSLLSHCLSLSLSVCSCACREGIFRTLSVSASTFNSVSAKHLFDVQRQTQATIQTQSHTHTHTHTHKIQADLADPPRPGGTLATTSDGRARARGCSRSSSRRLIPCCRRLRGGCPLRLFIAVWMGNPPLSLQPPARCTSCACLGR
jgi:hypothetical protein